MITNPLTMINHIKRHAGKSWLFNYVPHFKIWRKFLQDPANIYLLKANNKSIRKWCDICSKLTIKTPEVLVFLLSTLKFFHSFFCFYCFEQVNVSWGPMFHDHNLHGKIFKYLIKLRHYRHCYQQTKMQPRDNERKFD